jgi:hypothetical protein
MAPVVLALIAAVPCIYWTQGIDTRPALESAGIKRLCVPSDQVDTWRKAGFHVTAVSDADFAGREALPVPGTTPRPGVASPTRAPWIVASGWRVTRTPTGKYSYAVPAGKAALALAEAAAYGADAVVKIDPADAPSAGAMLGFLDSLPPADLPPVADFGVVDDGSPVTAEVMNLLARRNLLFEIEKAPSTRYRINVAIGSAGYPAQDAADPSGFAQNVRAQLTDEQRSLRIYGSEVVIARLTSDGKRARLHLINYGGREIDGLRVRVRGPYQGGDAYIAGSGKGALLDQNVADGAIEFSLPKISAYAVVDLR